MASDPIQNPRDEDAFRIGSVLSPGLAILSGFKRGYGWEVKKGKGVKGSTSTLNEFPPCEGAAEILLWESEHFTAWESFQRLLKYDPTRKDVVALDWYHPSTESIELRSVVCKGIGARIHKGQGLYSITVEFLEYHPPPPKSAVQTPTGSKSNGTGGSGSGSGAGAKSTDPVADAKQAEIKRLLDEARKP